MRKNKVNGNGLIIAVIIVIIASFFAAGCARNEQTGFSWDVQTAGSGNGIQASSGTISVSPLIFNRNTDLIEIRERMFIAQINDVYLNADDYLNKTIKLEGIFMVEEYEELQWSYCYVMRYGPGGCCGYDGLVGFEVRWGEDQPYPDTDAWVEATGVLKYYNEQEVQFLYLDLASLTVMEKRGTEYVKQ